MVVLIVLLGVTMDEGMGSALYYVLVAACTLGDTSIATQSSLSKLLLLTTIPLLMFGMQRWMTTVASFVAKNGETKVQTKEKLNAAELMELMETLKLEDGLLTRADFLEIMLLSMKKVDPELIMALRDGFQKTTHSGSLDLTRAQLIESAMSALGTN